MAAVEFDNGQGGLLAVDASRLSAVSTWDPVDASRLSAVSTWDPTWAGVSAAAVGSALHPPTQSRSIPVRSRFSVTVDYHRTVGSEPLLLAITVRSVAGLWSRVDLETLRPSTLTYAAPLPTCIDYPCSLSAISFIHSIATVGTDVRAVLMLRGATDSTGALDVTAASWGDGALGVRAPDAVGAHVTGTAHNTAQGAGLTVAMALCDRRFTWSTAGSDNRPSTASELSAAASGSAHPRTGSCSPVRSRSAA